jgi:hypothetical protein
MHNRIRAFHNRPHGLFVEDRALDEPNLCRSTDKVLSKPRRKIVERPHLGDRVKLTKVRAEIRADESGTACHHDFHGSRRYRVDAAPEGPRSGSASD